MPTNGLKGQATNQGTKSEGKVIKINFILDTSKCVTFYEQTNVEIRFSNWFLCEGTFLFFTAVTKHAFLNYAVQFVLKVRCFFMLKVRFFHCWLQLFGKNNYVVIYLVFFHITRFLSVNFCIVITKYNLTIT